jgi:transcriptional regulator with XRE-family HTH domain
LSRPGERQIVENLRERLKQIRQSRGLKQKEMAQKLEISSSAYSKIESGKIELTVKNLLKIGSIFNDISLGWFLTGKNSIETWGFGKYSEEVREMLTYISNNQAAMHSLFSYFYQLKNRACGEKEWETASK